MTEGLLAVDLSARARSVAVQTEGGDYSAMRSDVAKVFFEALLAVMQGDYCETSEERRKQWRRNLFKISGDMFNFFLFQVAIPVTSRYFLSQVLLPVSFYDG
jgi:hypothetical protein